MSVNTSVPCLGTAHRPCPWKNGLRHGLCVLRQAAGEVWKHLFSGTRDFFFFFQDQRVQISKCTAVVLNQTWLCTVAVRNLARWSLSTSLKLKPTSNIRFANRLGAYIATYCIALSATYASVHVTELRMQMLTSRWAGKVAKYRTIVPSVKTAQFSSISAVAALSFLPSSRIVWVQTGHPCIHPYIFFSLSEVWLRCQQA